MLVLSRRINEEICFPHLGIRVRLLALSGQRIQVGIVAPRSVAIRRGELEPDSTQSGTSPTNDLNHRVRNELNALRLSLTMLDRQIERCDFAGAHATFLSMLTRLREADLCEMQAAVLPTVIAASAHSTAPRVLVIDDDANERELLAGLLRMDGCVVETAGDGREALAQLERAGRPDVVLLDMHMPNMDGRETLQAIRSRETLRDLVVFGVSGSLPAAHDISVGGHNGIDNWFRKPLDPSLLVAQVRQRKKRDLRC